MDARKNIFAIGRKGHKGDEDQLTEMLAFLWQEAPELVPLWLGRLLPQLGRVSDWIVDTQVVLPSKRRPDVRLRVSGEAVVLIESKLDADEGDRQLQDYAEYLIAEPEPTKALIFLTQKPASSNLPTVEGVSVHHVRWQTMRDVLDGSRNPLARDFREMLTEEGLVVPTKITPEEWGAWAHSFEISDRVIEIMNEAQPHLIKLEPGYQKTGPTTSNATNLLRIQTFAHSQFALLFSPGKFHGYEGHIGLIAINSEVTDPAQRRSRAEAAAAKLGPDAWVHYGDWVGVYAPVRVVLGDCEDFQAQVRAAVSFAREALGRLRDVGYLRPPLEALPSDTAIDAPDSLTSGEHHAAS